MESYDSWPMLDQFANWNIVDDGKALAKEGLWLKAFLPAANSSVVSYIGCLQGMQGTNRFAVHDLPTGLINNLNQLNFLTREINGCPADWAEFVKPLKAWVSMRSIALRMSCPAVKHPITGSMIARFLNSLNNFLYTAYVYVDSQLQQSRSVGS